LAFRCAIIGDIDEKSPFVEYRLIVSTDRRQNAASFQASSNRIYG
jgi:hypothetical protein